MLISQLPPEIAALARKRQTADFPAPDELHQLFRWDDSEEGYVFWSEINSGNYDSFYAKYGRPDYTHPNDGAELIKEEIPQQKEWVPKVGERVMCTGLGYKEPVERVFAFKHNEIFFVIQPGHSLGKQGNLVVEQYSDCKPVPTTRRITRAEIAKALNIEGDNFEIVD